MNKKRDLEKLNLIIAKIRKGVNLDGGDLELVKIEENYIHIKFKGRCATCHTLPHMVMNLENKLKSEFPEIKGIKLS